LNARGIALYGFDHRGHGRSPGVRGHIPSLEAVRGDIDHFIAEAKKAHPEKPVFLYGHSMGGLLVLDYGLVCKPDISGVICTAPALSTGDPVAWARLLAGKALYVLVPSFTMPNGLDVQNLSRDPMVVKAYTSDPLVTPLVSARLGLDLINTGPWVLNHAREWVLPLLLMQGTKDHIVSPEATARFAAAIPQNLITFKEWQGLYHEIHNEFEKEMVIQIMLDWLNQYIGELIKE
jgi:alpha-beta hydrolase superfamily lysophospholipase